MHTLVIDDDAKLRKSLRLALETMGHQVSDARDGREAEAVLARRAFDVAFQGSESPAHDLHDHRRAAGAVPHRTGRMRPART